MRSAKGTLDYWYGRLRKNSFKRKDGSTYTSREYQVYMSVGGKQQRFNLDSGNKEVAAEKALEIYMFSRSNGPAATLEKYRRKTTTKVENPTVGDLLREIGELRLIKAKTFTDYSRKLRTVVSGSLQIKSDKSRYDYFGPGNKLWRSKVDSIPLSQFTPDKIMKWRSAYLKNADQDPVSQRRARASLTSLLRNSKSLFSPKYTTHLSFKLPNNPFEGITIGGSTTRQYKSEVDFLKLAHQAKDELFVQLSDLPPINPNRIRMSKVVRNKEKSKREQFKILILCLGCGLRRSEADNLLWKNVNFRTNTITVEISVFGDVKGSSSEREIDADNSVMKLLRKFKKEGHGQFVLESDLAPKPEATYHYYRCDRHFKGLIKWLHKQGVKQRNALHELRKEYGSQVTEQFGIYAASKALGHSEVTTTARSYLEKKGHKSISIF